MRQLLTPAIYIVSRVLMANVVSSSDLASFYPRIKETGWLGEYGLLANLFVLVVTALSRPDTHIQYLLGAKAVALMLDAAFVHAIWRRGNALHTHAFILASALLYSFWLDRLDLYIGALLVVAVVRPDHLRAIAIALAALIKFPMLAMGAVPFIASRDRSELRNIALAAAVFLAGLVVTAGWMGMDAALMPFTFHAGRTPQMESLVGSLMAMGGALGLPISVSVDHGAAHVHGEHDALYRVLGQLVLVVGVGITAWRLFVARMATERALLVAMIAYTVFNPVGSGQFLVVPVMMLPWCLPVETARERLVLGLCVLASACAGVAFMLYPRPLQLDEVFLGWNILKNLCLLGAWASLMRGDDGATASDPAPSA